MSYLSEELKKRELPEILKMNDGTEVTRENYGKRREELLHILSEESYGITPSAPEKVRYCVTHENSARTFGGKAIYRKLNISFDTPKGEFSFPVEQYIPKCAEKKPAFIHINFRDNVFYPPVEEIIDNGFGLVTYCYHDVCKDSLFGKFESGLFTMYHEDGAPRRNDEWGKIGVWAYSCSRVLDYLILTDEVMTDRVAVVGHSRLGKTALWAAAQDERFFMACSNDSGFGGAAIHKKGSGERVSDFIKCGSWDWYCEKFKSYLGKEDENTVYDQHMLLSLIVPRHICVGSATCDKGADPMSEFLNCFAQNGSYALFGLRGLVTPDEYPSAGADLSDGMISYHLREGQHSFCRSDWQSYMNYFNKVL